MPKKISFLFLICCSALKAQNVPVWEAKPVVITDTVRYDTDDPAIWYNARRPKKSLIIGTDKGGKSGDGGIYVFDLNGKNLKEKNILGISRPNNVDIAYGLKLPNGKQADIAVCTERNTNKIRVISLPDMKIIDGGGISVFEGEAERSPMGIALYTHKGEIYAIVGRKSGPAEGYLFQYQLKANAQGIVEGQLVRKFGKYSGKKEIESIAVDNELGYVYYSDENIGIRKYYAHPDSSSTELALFGTEGFKDDHEGISIYKTSVGTGYILVSDQQANQFRIFPREGTLTSPNQHPLLGIVKTQTQESDGSDVTHLPLGKRFRRGLFVAMSTDRTFQYYRWEDIIKGLEKK
ncbi:MAG: phytase [Runella sp.]